MFHHPFTSFFFLVASLSILAAATTPTTTVSSTPPAVTSGAPANQCNGSNLQCCDAADRSDGSRVGNLLADLGVVIQGAEVLVGIHCSPIDVLGIGQNECHSQALCCTNNNFSGIIAIGCVPINISW